MLTHNPDNERIKRRYFTYLRDAKHHSEATVDAVAKARREKTFPTLEQVKHAIERMPRGSDIERRNRALVAFTLLSGARDSAIASMKLKHVDLAAGNVYQDACEVNTKFSKTFTTFFFPVGDEIHQIVAAWVAYLREDKLWGNDDPLFPATHMIVGASRQFEAAGQIRDRPIKVAMHQSKREGASEEYLAEPRRLLAQLEDLGPAKMLEAIRASR